PGVDRLPVGLAGRGGMIVIRPAVGSYRSAYDGNALRVRAEEDLLIGADDPVNEQRVLRRGDRSQARRAAEVVDGLEDEEIAHTGLCQYVAIETRQRVGSQSVKKQAIASRPDIEHAQAAGGARGGEPARKIVGPTQVAVVGNGMSVRERIAQRDDRSPGRALPDIDSGDDEPVGDGGGASQPCVCDMIAMNQKRGLARAGMARLPRR